EHREDERGGAARAGADRVYTAVGALLFWRPTRQGTASRVDVVRRAAATDQRTPSASTRTTGVHSRVRPAPARAGGDSWTTAIGAGARIVDESAERRVGNAAERAAAEADVVDVPSIRAGRFVAAGAKANENGLAGKLPSEV